MLNKKIIKFGAGIFTAVALSGMYYSKNSEDFFKRNKTIEDVVLKEEISDGDVKSKIEKIKRELNSNFYKKDKIDDSINQAFNNISDIPDYISREYVRAIIKVESSDCKNLISEKDASGCMQLTIDAWNEVEKKRNYSENVFNKDINVEVGVKYLKWLNQRFENSYSFWGDFSKSKKRRLISYAYNGGFMGLKKTGLIPKFKETRLYGRKVEKEMEKNSS